MENITVQDLLNRIITNPDKYTVEDNGYEYKLSHNNNPTYVFIARHTEFKHILNCIHTLKELLDKTITSEYIDSVSSFFDMVKSVCTYSCNYSLQYLLNNQYIQSSIYSDLTELEKQIIITYYISIPKSVVTGGTDSEGNNYNSVKYISIY